MQHNQQQLLEKYQKLPDELREAIFSTDVAYAIQSISRKHGLHIDKMGELASETGLVMMGATHPKNYISNLSYRLGVNKEKAILIAKEVNEQIFSKVRESLKNIHGIGKEESAGGQAENKPEQEKKAAPPPNLPTEKIGKTKESPKITEIEKEKMKEETIREIEKPEPKAKKEEELKSSVIFAEKTQEGIMQNSVKTTEVKIPEPEKGKPPLGKYLGKDPYREQMD